MKPKKSLDLKGRLSRKAGQPGATAGEGKATDYGLSRLGITSAEDGAQSVHVGPIECGRFGTAANDDSRGAVSAFVARRAEQEAARQDELRRLFTDPGYRLKEKPQPVLCNRHAACAPDSLPATVRAYLRGHPLLSGTLGVVALLSLVWWAVGLMDSAPPQEAAGVSPAPPSTPQTLTEAPEPDGRRVSRYVDPTIGPQDAEPLVDAPQPSPEPDPLPNIWDDRPNPTATDEPSAPELPAAAVPVQQPVAIPAPPPAPAAQAAPSTQPTGPRYRPCPTGLSLTAIVRDPAGNWANVNGRFVRAGDSVVLSDEQRAQVIEVTTSSVEMELDGERFVLRFGTSSPASRRQSRVEDDPGGGEPEESGGADEATPEPDKPASKRQSR